MEIVNKEGEYKPKRGLNDKEITPRTESLPDINTSNEPLPDHSDEQGDQEEHY